MPQSLLIQHDDHIRGSIDAAIVIVLYTDYQCPTCRAAHLAIKDLQKRLGTQLCTVLRHFPQTDRHPYAELAAECAEAAGAQGNFWAMHDALFALQASFEPAMLPALAERLGLDPDLLTEDVTRRAFRARVERSASGGTRLGVVSAPTLFINGQRYDGDIDEGAIVDALMRFVA
ncbi:DsbA family protein [Massilia sp. DWR3-1-1]|uniref:DsbA family protein n=1 Tax=Massilia sp. DWR3-1-1 TaxID=2804559 RepID=UPI003CF19806